MLSTVEIKRSALNDDWVLQYNARFRRDGAMRRFNNSDREQRDRTGRKPQCAKQGDVRFAWQYQQDDGVKEGEWWPKEEASAKKKQGSCLPGMG